MQAYYWARKTAKRAVNQASRFFYRASWSSAAAYVLWAGHSKEGLQLPSALERANLSHRPRSRTSRVSINPDEESGSYSRTITPAKPYISSISPVVMPKKIPKQELEARELRSHATIRKATEVVEEHGKPSTKTGSSIFGIFV